MIQYTRMPKSFILQWHITEKCNWHCKHCYQKENITMHEEPLPRLKEVLNQYVSLIKRWGIKPEKARIHIAGGEPLLRPDFFEFAKMLHRYKQIFKWGILSNGSLINKDTANKLKRLGLYSCQISIEGCEKTNDYIRGKGNFKKSLQAINYLVEQGILVRVSLTLTSLNIKDIPKLVVLFKKLGVSYFSTRRLVPQGRGERLKNFMLNRDELFDYYLWVERTNKELCSNKERLRINIGCDSGIFNNKKPKDSPIAKNFCGILNGRILVVMPDGSVMPCRRVPIIIGNVFEKNLYELWASDKLRKIRDLNNAHQICKICENFENCFGGAKCITYACTRDLFSPDVECTKQTKRN